MRQTMPPDSEHFYSSAPVQHLFARELAALTPILGGVYGTTGLLMRPHVAAPGLITAPLVGNLIDLSLDERQHFLGPLRCAPADLPLASESCKLVIAQHVFERLDDPTGCASEFARVLAPEGVALVLGFNPISLWRPWLSGKARGLHLSLRLQSAARCQHVLNRHGIEILQTRYLGAAVPWLQRTAKTDDASRAEASGGTPLDPIRGGWLLLARKRRSTLTPLRLQPRARELTLNPRLAPGARRECA